MYKLLYWSIKKDKLLVVMFDVFDNLMKYIYNNEDDVELEEHFVKIVKEISRK